MGKTPAYHIKSIMLCIYRFHFRLCWIHIGAMMNQLVFY